MKKLLSLFITLTFVQYIWGQQEINGLFYNLNVNDKTAEVTENYDLYTGDITIPESVSYEGVTYKVTKIGDFAFYDCSSLTNVIIPETVEQIGMYAFQNCHRLKTADIPSRLKVLGEQAFGECSSISEFSIPSTIEEIGISAFEGCVSMKNIHIAEGITQIPSSLFSRCESLTEITLPVSVDSIGDWAFTNCLSLKSIKLNEGLSGIAECAFAFCTDLESVTLPSSLRFIGDDVFNHCISMKSIEMPAKLEYIGSYIFDNCEMLGYIRCHAPVPADVYMDKLMDYCDQTVLYVPMGAKDAYSEAGGWCSFKECREIGDNEEIEYALKRIDTDDMSFIASPLDSRLAKVVCMKNDVKYSGDIEIPSSIKDNEGTVYTVNHIGEGAFELCIDLSSVAIPSSVTSIGEWAFSGAHSLNFIDIPESVTKIGDAAFFGCASIKSVTLHNTLQYIGQDSFSGCFQLFSIFSEMEEPIMIEDRTFDYFEEQTLFIPVGCRALYKYTDYWWMFQNIEEYETDGIENPVVDKSGDRIYDLQGRRVIKPMNEIYIKDGKKIIL